MLGREFKPTAFQVNQTNIEQFHRHDYFNFVGLPYLVSVFALPENFTLKKNLESYLVIKVEDQPRKFAPNPEPRLLSVKRFFNTSP